MGGMGAAVQEQDCDEFLQPTMDYGDMPSTNSSELQIDREQDAVENAENLEHPLLWRCSRVTTKRRLGPEFTYRCCARACSSGAWVGINN
jgi:hypothetical protein